MFNFFFHNNWQTLFSCFPFRIHTISPKKAAVKHQQPLYPHVGLNSTAVPSFAAMQVTGLRKAERNIISSWNGRGILHRQNALTKAGCQPQ